MKAGTGVREVADARVLRLAADIVAVVEEHGALALHLDHGFHVAGQRGVGARGVLLGVSLPERGRLEGLEPGGDIAVEHVVGRGLIRDDVGPDLAPGDLRVCLGGIPVKRDGQRFALLFRFLRPAERLVERFGRAVHVAQAEAALDPLPVDLDEEAHAVVHGDRERLGATHAAEPRREHEAPA